MQNLRSSSTDCVEGWSLHELESTIELAWGTAPGISPLGSERDAIEATLSGLDCGRIRVAQRYDVGQWTVNQWVKKAVLLSFRLSDGQLLRAGDLSFFDKVTSKFANQDEDDTRASGVRVAPPAVARRGSFLAQNVVMMPSFVNIGAYIDEGTMIDSWASVGSCAQIGKNVHIASGVCIGGVLEPLQAGPVIIGDGAFIGARAEVAEGVRVGEGAVLSMGVYLGASTKIVDRATGEVYRGEVPPYAVVVPGALPGKPLPDGSPGPSLYCAVIVKTVDAQTRAKTGINELLRD